MYIGLNVRAILPLDCQAPELLNSWSYDVCGEIGFPQLMKPI